MEYRLSCGQYYCCIIGSIDLLNKIPDEWTAYRTKTVFSSDAIIIHLKESSTKDNDVLSEGWNKLEVDNSCLVAYVKNSKCLFSLQQIATNEIVVSVRKALANYVRLAIHFGLMMVLYSKAIGLHGVTVLCANEIIILSAPSETGKTTLAKLLEKYSDAVVINGDFAMLSPTNEGVIFEPTPFCGTSGRSLNHRFRVNRIVFLGQAKVNIWRTLDGREAMTRFMSNAFIPTWDFRMQQAVQDNILKCISKVKMNAFDFAPTQQAAEAFLGRVKDDTMLCLE